MQHFHRHVSQCYCDSDFPMSAPISTLSAHSNSSPMSSTCGVWHQRGSVRHFAFPALAFGDTHLPWLFTKQVRSSQVYLQRIVFHGLFECLIDLNLGIGRAREAQSMFMGSGFPQAEEQRHGVEESSISLNTTSHFGRSIYGGLDSVTWHSYGMSKSTYTPLFAAGFVVPKATMSYDSGVSVRTMCSSSCKRSRDCEGRARPPWLPSPSQPSFFSSPLASRAPRETAVDTFRRSLPQSRQISYSPPQVDRLPRCH